MSLYDDASLIMIPSGVKTGKVYSQKPMDSDGQFTFTRASEATRLVDGVVTKVRTNSILQSNDFDTTWATANSTITGGQADKDGGTSAWVVASTVVASETRMRQSHTFTVGQVIALSCYMKAGTVNFGIVRTYAITGGGRVWFDLLNGTVGTENSGLTGSIESAGGGWYRCSITGVVDTTGAIDIAPAPSDNDYLSDAVGETIYIQNAQLEQGLVSTPYVATTTVAVSEGPVANMPRLNSVAGGCPSLLLEPQRTNLLTQSEYFGGSEWTKNNTTVASGFTSPDGNNNAYKMTDDATDSKHAVYDLDVLPTDGNVYTRSVFVKKGTARYVVLSARHISSSSGTSWIYDFNGNNWTLTGSSGAGQSIEDYGNGWIRLSISHISDSNFNNDFSIGISSGPNLADATYSGGGDTIYIYGAQIELGNYSTSLIPNYGTTAGVTRVADLCNKTGITSLIGQTEGTLYGEFSGIESESEYTNLTPTISDGSNNNRIMVYNDWNGLGSIVVRVVTGGSSLINTSALSAPSYQSTNKIAIAYKANDYAVYFNGVQIYTNTSVGAPPACSKVTVFNNVQGSNTTKVLGSSSLLFKTRLTNTELATLTTL